jgi:hypothetical protein
MITFLDAKMKNVLCIQLFLRLSSITVKIKIVVACCMLRVTSCGVLFTGELTLLRF